MTDAERKRAERERMRAQGYVLKQVWVHPDDMTQEPEQLQCIAILRECLRAFNLKPNFNYGDRKTSYQLASRIERYLDAAANNC